MRTMQKAAQPASVIWLLLIIVLVGGCTVTLTQAGERVRVVKTKDAVAGCLFLGKVVVSGPVYTAMGGFVGAAADRAINRKNRTAEMGGNTLLRLGEEEDDAYLCPAPARDSGLVLKASSVRVTGNPDEVKGCQRLESVSASTLQSVNAKTSAGDVVRSEPWMDYELRIRLFGYTIHADAALLGPLGHVDYYRCKPE